MRKETEQRAPSSTDTQRLNAENKQLKKQLISKQESVDTLQEENERLHRELTDLTNSYIEITQAQYWRITAPMRKLTGGLKHLLLSCKLTRYPLKALKMLITRGPKATWHFLRHRRKARYSASGKIFAKQRRQEEQTVFPREIKFSVLVPLYNTPLDFLKEMIESVQAQTYANWELCLADGSDSEHGEVERCALQYARRDHRICYQKLEKNGGISENTNACIAMATGEYLCLFDHDDLLHPSALFEYMRAICEQDADFLYCDEDKFKKRGRGFFEPHFKPDFAPDNLRANNYICHFTVFDRRLLDEVGGFRKECDGSQDHDMVLRLTEKAQRIVHIPKVLYHWRVSDASVASDPYAKPYTITAGIRAVSEHLERCGLEGTVESSPVHPNIYRIRYTLTAQPLVSILIPNCNHVSELSVCLQSILQKTTYPNYEIIIIENNSNQETFAYYETLKAYEQIRVVVYHPPAGFNYSAINNYGARFAKGEHLILLNNDVEIITENWIEEMLMYSQRADVGAVGAILYYPNDTIQHAGVILGIMGVAAHAFKHFPRGTAGYFGRAAYQQDLSAVTAACLMMPRRVYEEVEGLDETFEVAFNDVDLCMRIREKGYHIVWTPYAELYHHESISRGNDESGKKKKRFAGEVARFQERWRKELDAGDPYYNPHLTLMREDFTLRP